VSWRQGAAACLAALAAGCSHSLPPLNPDAPLRLDAAIAFEDGDVLDLHLSRPCVFDSRHPFILYATGDGGWRGKDRDAFERMTAWGYPMAGFSAPNYLRHVVRHTHETTPADVARDYERIIRTAKARMAVGAEVPTILVGVSRGSGLAVAAAGEPDLQASLAGVVAVALTREEEYVHRLRRRRSAPQSPPEMVMLDNYEYLPRLRGLPLAIVQSTHDDYLPAEEARRLLAPDSATRRLHPIVSKNHSFSDAREPLYAELKASLAWVAHFLPAPAEEP
jgi:type IV secretory pathway VirJ component